MALSRVYITPKKASNVPHKTNNKSMKIKLIVSLREYSITHRWHRLDKICIVDEACVGEDISLGES